ncbi:alanine racemase [Mesorhizobium sp. RP14(2022)]|uniref:Alanine racemase n=1 Tax=Mesorhizobium liriopis TaxID=2953882 RepID=A0ABT1CDJ2_9HYPH|nr:alanine racemase [Mesorhizobium liriopis]MCO6052261.1 alanine racemase [Mesorhizobium liriopis]
MSQLMPFEADILLDDRIRGFPSGHDPLPLSRIGEGRWRPTDGIMALPLLSLDRTAFEANVALMMQAVREADVSIAPHAKTPMSPELAHRLVAAGAWGTTVADIRQASVMLKAGLKRLILANETGGAAAARRLAAMLSHYPDAEIHVFVDSEAALAHLAEAWRGRDDLPPMGLLIELGFGRAGLRSLEAAEGVALAALAAETPTFKISGTAAYEGAAAVADPAETQARIDALLDITAGFHRRLRTIVGGERALLLTAGGSVFFDRVLAKLHDAVAECQPSRLILRSGAIFFHDHGIYQRGMEALDARGGLVIEGKTVSAAEKFRPALRAWGEVLSVPEPGTAICGLGMRDVAIDQGLPLPLQAYRDGVRTVGTRGAIVMRLNDQHAFLKVDLAADIQVGDVVEFGLSHPCTCLDRHAILYETGADGTVIEALPLRFG